MSLRFRALRITSRCPYGYQLAIRTSMAVFNVNECVKGNRSIHNIFLYGYYFISALLFILLLKSIDLRTAKIVGHALMISFIIIQYLTGMILERLKNGRLKKLAPFFFLFAVFFLTNYLWNMIYKELRDYLVAVIGDTIWVNILIQVPGYLMPLGIILFYKIKYHSSLGSEYRLRVGDLDARLTVKNKSIPLWVCLTVFMVPLTFLFVIYVSGFYENPSVEVILNPVSLSLIFPLMLYSIIEITKNEIFFRGFLQREAESVVTPMGAIIFQAVAYAVPHYIQGHPGGLTGGTFALIGALVFGYATFISRGIGYAVIMHFIVALIVQIYAF